ncbi:LTA synthase family protein [Evansella tamaricis]|uniref:LTA synthase family protein n=1 Tax=Evansella tamaricis TaxID=2069301 RepID=A0ABS6JBW2_9BACI|nr:LTA synthase family protein [Evansella tamaricis]MBU9710679.1 LTA synthase family protein [Evansella tamaricis]
MENFINHHRFMLLCLVLLWMKTFIVSLITFDININQYIEALVFFVNPLFILLIVYSIGLMLKPKLQVLYFLTVSTLLTVVLYSNVVYYREFSDVITLPMLLMGGNMGDLSTSIFALIHWSDFLYFIDIVLISLVLIKKFSWFTVNQTTFGKSKPIFITVMVFFTIAISQVSFLDKSYTFNRNQLIQTLGIYNFYLYDAFVHTQTSTQTVFAEEDDWSSIEKHLETHRVDPNPDMFGAAEDMNVIIVSLESVESFVIEESINGEEITPFINELIEDSFYFENFYYQTGQGKTSDAEFLINTSLYPLGRGAVFLTHAENEWNALPKTLVNHGYTTANFHANDLTFYNRNVMYDSLGYTDTYSFSDYKISMMNSVGWGMKDIDFVEQSMDFIKEIPEPFYGKMLTLTNHFPYHLEEEDQLIEPFDSESNVVNQYFPTVRYTDEAMRILVERLKEDGLYENTVLVMYGDHYGIANSHYEELSTFLGKKIDIFESMKLERVPLLIHIPGMEGERIDSVSGQVDVMPTLLNLLGIPEGDHIMFGNDLFAEDRDDFAVLRNGSVITDDLIYTNDMCFNTATGEQISLDSCEDIQEKGAMELFYSDKIIYGDLFRFLD